MRATKLSARDTEAWQNLLAEIRLIHRTDEARRKADDARRLDERSLVAQARQAIIAQNSIHVTELGLHKTGLGEFRVFAHAETAFGARKDMTLPLYEVCWGYAGSKHELAGHLRAIARRLDAMAKKASRARKRGKRGNPGA